MLFKIDEVPQQQHEVEFSPVGQVIRMLNETAQILVEVDKGNGGGGVRILSDLRGGIVEVIAQRHVQVRSVDKAEHTFGRPQGQGVENSENLLGALFNTRLYRVIRGPPVIVRCCSSVSSAEGLAENRTNRALPAKIEALRVVLICHRVCSTRSKVQRGQSVSSC